MWIPAMRTMSRLLRSNRAASDIMESPRYPVK